MGSARDRFWRIILRSALIVTIVFVVSMLLMRNTDSTLPTFIDEPDRIVQISDGKSYKNNRTSDNQKGYCTRRRQNVAFLKVHKAASSTVMNVMYRHAKYNHLNLVLPKSDQGPVFNYLGFGQTTVKRDNILPPPNGETYNVLSNHVVYDRKAFESIMPSDTSYIAIVREPTSRFLSAVIYHQLFPRLHNKRRRDVSIHEFLQGPDSFGIDLQYIHNRMSFDLGLPPKEFGNKERIETFIRQLDEDFRLVMIYEHFEESLVLMKRYMCWNLSDIIYVPRNVRPHKKPSLTAEDTQTLRHWDTADYTLYAFFLSKFHKQVADEGPGFTQEVEEFKKINSLVNTFCRSKSTSFLNITESRWNGRFQVSRSHCDYMMLDEYPLVRGAIKAARLRLK